jgi:hypothetical protein
MASLIILDFMDPAAVYPVEVQGFRKITHHDFGGILRIYPKATKKNRTLSTCNWLHLETLG